MSRAAPRAVVFDLFHTLLRDRPGALPTVAMAPGRVLPSTAPLWLDLVRAWVPAVSLEGLVAANVESWRMAEDVRRCVRREVHAMERFGWLLGALGATGPGRAAAALAAHRAALVAATEIPAEHADLVRRLRRRGLRVGLITNYDDPAGLDAMLAAAGLEDAFDAVVSSAAIGAVKPGRRVFAAALTGLKVSADRAWYVGDNWATDMIGAWRAGMVPVWLNPGGDPAPEALPTPMVLNGLLDLEGRL